MNEQPSNRPGPESSASLTPPRTRSRRLSPARTARLIIAAIIVIALVIIGFQNNQDVRVSLFFWAFHTALVWALLIALVLGLVLGYLLRWLRPRFRPRRTA